MFTFLPILSLRRGRLIKLACAAFVLVWAGVPVINTQSQGTVPDYKNPRLPIDQRVNDLLSRMTLEEKVAQLTGVWQERPQAKPQTDFATSRGEFSAEKARKAFANGIGQIARQRDQFSGNAVGARQCAIGDHVGAKTSGRSGPPGCAPEYYCAMERDRSARRG